MCKMPFREDLGWRWEFWLHRWCYITFILVVIVEWTFKYTAFPSNCCTCVVHHYNHVKVYGVILMVFLWFQSYQLDSSSGSIYVINFLSNEYVSNTCIPCISLLQTHQPLCVGFIADVIVVTHKI